MFGARSAQNMSGKEVRVLFQRYPRYKWELTFNVLREGTVDGIVQEEFSTLLGFYNRMMGPYDSFLYFDPYDNAVVGQTIGIGDGTITQFPLVKAFGGFVEPVQAPQSIGAIYLNGVVQASGSYSVSQWGDTTPGVVTFAAAPSAGALITVDMVYYFPVRFTEDNLEFDNFLGGRWALKSIMFMSIL
jgi:uncharacterized protein (TIGR02217 family)